MGVRRLISSPNFRPLALLAALALVFWGRVLFLGQVLLPGDMLGGFLPFGGNPNAPWTILQWDSLAQYYPWRLEAARSIHSGVWPLWNPYQFTGTPLLANAQSAVFYPLNLPFWILAPAYAFGVSAFLHTLLAGFSTYFLARSWNVSRLGAVVAAMAFCFCGYLSAWALLPTLAATASWLPLCLLLLQNAARSERPLKSGLGLALALACSLLAGHAQIFFYILLTLAISVPFLAKRWLHGLVILELATVVAILLGLVQLLPTLELARLGHRSGGRADASAWKFVHDRALQWADLPGLAVPGQTSAWGSLSENFGYVGVGVLLLAVAAVVFIRPRSKTGAAAFPATLALCGLLYALATPFAALFFFTVPGIAQMGGTGRSLLIWSLGAALLAGFGLDILRGRIKSAVVPIVAVLWIGVELFGNAWTTQPTAPRAAIYPQTQITAWLQSRSKPEARVLFFTPKKDWLPEELLARSGRRHPIGVLPPNGATVYGIYDVNGYDSLSPKAYRDYINDEEGGPSPALNGNMVLLNNLRSKTLLDTLAVRYVVAPEGQAVPDAAEAFRAEGCVIWERPLPAGGNQVSGAAFYPGWKNGHYEPESFRLGGFVTLATLMMVAVGGGWLWGRKGTALTQS